MRISHQSSLYCNISNTVEIDIQTLERNIYKIMNAMKRCNRRITESDNLCLMEDNSFTENMNSDVSNVSDCMSSSEEDISLKTKRKFDWIEEVDCSTSRKSRRRRSENFEYMQPEASTFPQKLNEVNGSKTDIMNYSASQVHAKAENDCLLEFSDECCSHRADQEKDRNLESRAVQVNEQVDDRNTYGFSSEDVETLHNEEDEYLESGSCFDGDEIISALSDNKGENSIGMMINKEDKYNDDDKFCDSRPKGFDQSLVSKIKLLENLVSGGCNLDVECVLDKAIDYVLMMQEKLTRDD